MILGAMPEVWVMFVISGIIILACASGHQGTEKRRHIIIFALILPLTLLGVLGFVILPAAELILHSSRSDGLGSAQMLRYSVHPLSFLSFLLPRHFSAGAEPWDLFGRQSHWATSLFIGAPLLLLPLALPPQKASLLKPLGIIALLAAVVSTGSYVPGAAWIVDHFGKLFPFRYPEKALLLLHLLTAVAIAHGAEQLVTRPQHYRSLRFICATVAGALAVFVLTRPPSADLTRRLLIADCLVLIAVAAILFFLAILGRKLPQLIAAVLVCISGYFLAANNRNLAPVVPWNTLKSKPTLLPAQSAARIYSNSLSIPDDLSSESRIELTRALLPFGSGMILGIGNLNSPSSINLAADEELLSRLETLPRERLAPFLAALGVSWVTSIKPLSYPGLSPTARTTSEPQVALYQVRAAKPHVYIAERIRPVLDWNKFHELIHHGQLDPISESAVIAEADSGPTPSLASGKIISVEQTPQEVRLLAALDTPALIVRNESFYPGWRAEIDGHPVKLLRVNNYVQGVIVPAGEHKVRFYFAPKSLRYGIAVSVFSLFVVLILFIRAERRLRREPGH